MIYGQNVSASFLCLSCPALVLVLIMCTSSSVDLSKINDDDDGVREAGPWAVEKRDGAAYVMPDWVGRMARMTYLLGDC